MNKNTFSNRVTWYNFILCIFVVWIHAQNYGSVYRSGDDRGKAVV